MAADIEQLCSHQRQDWQDGRRCAVEEYIAHRPDLIADSDAILDLVYNEIVLREALGDRPGLEEYLRRFPALDAELRRQFDIHRLLETRDLSDSRRDYPADSAGASDIAFLRYAIVDILGRGGMGVVYKARDLELDRLVALKIIGSGRFAGPRERTRFRAEAHAVARLQHPNIVQIYDVGEQNGCPYMALELIEGPGLDQNLRKGAVPPRQAAQLIESLARAAHYAHSKGIIHRDLKPSNVMLTAEGVAKISDFGLAALPDPRFSARQTGTFIGTPVYASPEQWQDAAAVDARADVYSLGAILYEMLCGKPPFAAAAFRDMLDMVRDKDPLPPGTHKRSVPGDLEAICLKCLQKDPRSRYGTALELALDLGRFLKGEPVLARPVGRLERLGKWARRRPAAAALAIVLAAGLAFIPAAYRWHRLNVRASLESGARTYQKFTSSRDDAVFQAVCGEWCDDVPASARAAANAARDALAAVGFQRGRGPDRLVLAGLSAAQNLEVMRDCNDLVMIRADSVAQMEVPEAVARALDVLDELPPEGQRGLAYHLKRAQLLSQAGRPQCAAEEKSQASACVPVTWFDYFVLGRADLQKGNAAAAASRFQVAALTRPTDFWSQFLLAVSSLRLAKAAPAVVALDQCVELRPDFAWTYMLRATGEEAMKQNSAAQRDLDQGLVRARGPDTRYAMLVTRGGFYLRSGRLDEALAGLDEAVRMRPNQYQARIARAAVLMKLKRPDEAAKEVAIALRHQPPALVGAELLFQRGAIMAGRRDFQEALQACDQALRLQPDSAISHGLRAEALIGLGRYDEAARSLDQYLKFGGKPVPAFYLDRGLSRMQTRDYKGAVEDYGSAFGLKESTDIQCRRAWAYFFAAAFALARADFDDVLKKESGRCEAYIGRALAEVMLNRCAEAITDADRAWKIGTDVPEFMDNLACAYALVSARARAPELQETCRRRALEALRKTLELVPPAERLAFFQEKMVHDKAFESLRKSPEFKAIGDALIRRDTENKLK
jgi:tetratricopeptide (TPR) repeat protein